MTNDFKRALNFAFTDFYRNKGTSIAAIFVLMITTLIITGLVVVGGTSNFLVKTLQEKIDITAYFKEDTSEQDIMNVKDQILKDSPDVKSIQYVSKEEALEQFSEKHQGNDVFSRALLEVGGNPFLPSLNIITSGNTTQYEQISHVLESDQFSNFIEKVDFSEKKDTIEKVFSITSNITKFGIVLGALLVLIAISVVFNTIKLVIDNSKDEITTMRIVGASNWFLRAPFILEGAIFGAIAFLISFLVAFLFSYSLSNGISIILPGFDLFHYFVSNLWMIIPIQLLTSIGLGAGSSYFVVKKYLNI